MVNIPCIETYFVVVDGKLLAVEHSQFMQLRLEKAAGNIQTLDIQGKDENWIEVDYQGNCPNHPFESSEKSIIQLLKIQRERKK